MLLSQQNGEQSSNLTGLLISLYKAFGQLMIMMNDNVIARSRYDTYISMLESRASAAGYTGSDSSSSVSDDTDPDFEIDDDVLKDYTGNDIHVTVPDGVTRIDDYAFSNKSDIQTIVLPESVTVIGENAFRHCDSLETIHLHEGITEIASDAFTYCDSLTSVELPRTLETIGEDAFCFCNHIKRIRIPSTLTDIGNDAFLYCNGLETVVVYGGTRNSRILENLKQHFPSRVNLIWEGDDKPKPKTATSAKKTKQQKNKAEKAPQAAGKFNDRVTFALPEGYEYTEDKDADGNQTVKIKVHPSQNSSNETDDEITFLVIEKKPDDVSPQKSALDILEENNQECTVVRRLPGSPDALIMITSNTSSILGVPLILNMIHLAIELSHEEVILISCIKSKAGDSEESLQPTLDQLKTIWGSMSIDGRSVTAADMDMDALLTAVAEKESADKEQGEIPLDQHILEEGNFITVGNRWRMELPYGIRVRTKTADQDQRFDELRIDLDRRTIGYALFGSTVRTQDEACTSVLTMKLLSGEKYGKVVEVYLRNDDVLAVQLTLELSDSGKSAFMINIHEKQSPEVQTNILFLPPCKIENMNEVLETIKNKQIGLDHPFGQEWEMYWKTVVRMASSISPVGEEVESLPLAAPVQVEGGLSIQLPDGFKPLNVKDSTKVVYIPTTKKPTQADLKRLEKHPYCIVQDSSKLEMPEDNQEDLPEEINAVRTRALSHLIERELKDLFAAPIHESMTESGYKALYLSRVNDECCPDIVMVSTDGHYAIWQFRSDSGYSPAKLLQAAFTVFDSVLNGSSTEATPLAIPPVPDLLHEHLTLVSSGAYTTRRDADFIGQPIRMLMEKNGCSSEEAYALMEMPDDHYTLDVEAHRLATVFRLDRNLFDPYKDTEAMIHHGMFEDVKMLHALRSLAWTVFCKADRQRRTPASYSFEELEKMGDLIGKNDLNYSADSYCSGLCSHYDWRVFYVPDAYLDSDCESHTDLRPLCRKENRSGNATFVMFGGGPLSSMNRTNDLINRNEETLESLEALRKDLTDLLPVMKTIYEGLMDGRDRSEKLTGVLADALTAWCALAVAAKEPFYSEEANDSPEASAGLDGPMERPEDVLEQQMPAPKSKTPSRKTTTKKPSPAAPKNDLPDLNGATVIAPGQFIANMSLRNIIIPEGVTEIGDRAFYNCMALETVKLPTTLKTIGKMAFMSCRILRQVEIPEGVEEICDHAFGATNNLNAVYLPDSLQRADRYIFGLGGDSPYATAYMSGELAKRLQSNAKDSRFLSAISARHYVIDGVGYENMYDYWKPDSTSASTVFAETDTYDLYRSKMEEACKSGKSLQDMIEENRMNVNASAFSDKDAFELAIEHLDQDAAVSFAGKHFVLSGFGSYEKDMIDEIQKRGGIVHRSMVKSADYLIVCLEGPGASKTKKALEWRQKGAKNLIISDYQMWQAIFGSASAVSSHTAKKAVPESSPASTANRNGKTTAPELSGFENTINTSSLLAQASEEAQTDEEKKALLQAQEILSNMQAQMGSTSTAIEAHAENLRKQEERKQQRIEEAKKKGKSSCDETDMLVVLLNEEDLGLLHRDEKEFARIYAEDFGAYNEQQLIRLRRKVMPTIHDASSIEAAKSDMLSRPLDDRFTISTGNHFNVNPDWDFDAKGQAAIDATRLWYKEDEMPQLRRKMEEHKESTRQGVFDQLTTFRPEWSNFRGLRNDLHINISTNSDPVPEAHKLFHVKQGRDLDVLICLSNPALGYLTIPVMNVFASCWKVSPEEVWDAALQNHIEDSRGQSSATMSDAKAAKAKALASLKSHSFSKQTPENTANTQNRVSDHANKNANRIKELEESIAALKSEADSIRGFFGIFKRFKLRKIIASQQLELESLKNKES